MATAPQDPFNQGGPPPGEPPRQKSNVWLWVLAIVGGLGVLGILICCGSMFAFYRFGSGVLSSQVEARLDGNPVVERHVGEVESVAMNLTATAEESQNGNRDVLVFDVEGSKSDAKVAASVRGEEIISAELIMPDGTRHEVFTNETLNDPALDMDLEIDEGDLQVEEENFQLEEGDLQPVGEPSTEETATP